MDNMTTARTKVSFSLSPSSLNLFLECPRCFWLSIVKKQKRPSGPFPSLPSGVDRILKNHFDNYRMKGELPPELKHHKIEGKLFADMNLLKIWRDNFKGIHFVDPESGILLRGAVDDLLETESKLIVLDYKTRGFPLKEDSQSYYQNQLNLYNFLLRKNGYGTEDYSYLLFFIPKGINDKGHFEFDTELVKVNVNVKFAEDVFHKAITLIQNEMPEAKKECGFCQWNS